MQCLLIFYCYNVYKKAPQYYVIRTLPVLFLFREIIVVFSENHRKHSVRYMKNLVTSKQRAHVVNFLLKYWEFYAANTNQIPSVISGFCREVDENCALLRPNTFHNDYFHKRLQVTDADNEK